MEPRALREGWAGVGDKVCQGEAVARVSVAVPEREMAGVRVLATEKVEDGEAVLVTLAFMATPKRLREGATANVVGPWSP